MDFRHLKQFVTLAEILNFRRAAEKLNMSQPPLSVSIRKLESEVGVELFIRSKDGVRLTKSGEAALPEAKRALFHATQFSETARAASMGESGVLRMGFVGSATHFILPRILPVFRARHPGVQLVLREATSIRVMSGLEDDTLDVGVVRVPVSSRCSSRLLPLQTEHFLLAVPGSHPVAQLDSVKLQDLANEDFILYTPTDAAGLRMAAVHACQSRGFSPRVAQEAVQVQTVLSLVEAGLGIALVPAVSRRFAGDNIVYKTLVDFPESATIGISLAWRPETETAAARNLRLTAQEVFNIRSE